jgi:hypothetical protein
MLNNEQPSGRGNDQLKNHRKGIRSSAKPPIKTHNFTATKQFLINLKKKKQFELPHKEIRLRQLVFRRRLKWLVD